MSKRLLFTPLFIDGEERFKRNIKWVDYYCDLPELKWDELFMTDNASEPVLLEKFIKHIETKNIKFHITKSKVRLTRWSIHAYSFWYVAFGKAAKYAIENNYDQIIHCDSDVYVLKPRLVEYINNFKSGWLAFFCSMYNYPETTFQLIGKDSFETMYEFMTRDFLEFYPNDLAETRIPFTHIEKSFVGDRFGEQGPVPQNNTMDYYGQCAPSTIMKYNI